MLAATGMDWRRIELEAWTSSSATASTTAPAAARPRQCAGQDVVVVGAGNSAGQAVLNFANQTARVTILVRGDRLTKSMSAYLIERIEAHPLIDVHLETQLTELHEGRQARRRDLRRLGRHVGDERPSRGSSSASAAGRTPSGARASTS